MSSLCEIAIRAGSDQCDVLKHLNLTLLAPDIVAAILGSRTGGAGNQGHGRRLVVAEGGTGVRAGTLRCDPA